METNSGDICALPEGCIAHVISLTSPVDACRSAAVCTTFRSAAVSDTVWERFLPPDYLSVLSRAVQPVEYSSKKDLFFRLCEPILIDNGNMSFSLDKSSGAKCYMLSARQLLIAWGDTPRYWRWDHMTDSRFSEVAELVDVCWLEVRGKIESRVLTPKTTYAAYLVFKLDWYFKGFHFLDSETTVKLGSQVSKHAVKVQPLLAVWRTPDMPGEYGDAEENMTAARAPQARADDWMELQMGEFYNDEGEDGEVEMSLMEVKGGDWKSGLIIEGIEIKPKK